MGRGRNSGDAKPIYKLGLQSLRKVNREKEYCISDSW